MSHLCTFHSIFQTGHAVRNSVLGWELPTIVGLTSPLELHSSKGQLLMALCHIWQVSGRKRQSPVELGVMQGLICHAWPLQVLERLFQTHVFLACSLMVVYVLLVVDNTNSLRGLVMKGCNPLLVLYISF